VGGHAATGGGSGSNVAPWLIGIVAVIIVVVLVISYLPNGAPQRPAGSGMGGGEAPAMGAPAEGGMGGLSSDMRTNADRLFNRIMTAAEQGNQAEVDQFMPMAIQAYGMVDDLDDDGLFHLGLLHLTAGSYDQALQTAQRILADQPNHLLGLAVAAQASEGMGDTTQANEYWQRYLDSYSAESGKPLPAYVDHQPILPEYRRMAQEAVGGG
jgi:tetratricopeptide (TPR) repeat protein